MAHILNLTLSMVKLKGMEFMFTPMDLTILASLKMELSMEKENSFTNLTV